MGKKHYNYFVIVITVAFKFNSYYRIVVVFYVQFYLRIVVTFITFSKLCM